MEKIDLNKLAEEVDVDIEQDDDNDLVEMLNSSVLEQKD